MAKKKVTLVVSGIRRAAAIVETEATNLTTNSDGNQEGSVKSEVVDPLNVVLTLAGEAGDKFTVEVTVEDLGTATRKGRLNDDLGIRAYDIPLSDFE